MITKTTYTPNELRFIEEDLRNQDHKKSIGKKVALLGAALLAASYGATSLPLTIIGDVVIAAGLIHAAIASKKITEKIEALLQSTNDERFELFKKFS
jgi:hypothetical protein